MFTDKAGFSHFSSIAQCAKHLQITSKGQVTIPIQLMRKLGLNPGDFITFEYKKDTVGMTPVQKKMSALDLPKKYGKITSIKLSPSQLRKAREESWGARLPHPSSKETDV